MPSAPSNLQVRVTGKTITLNWSDNSNNETRFVIYRKIATGGSSSAQLSIYDRVAANQTSFVDTQVAAGNSYMYAVAAVNDTLFSSQATHETAVWILDPTIHTQRYLKVLVKDKEDKPVQNAKVHFILRSLMRSAQKISNSYITDAEGIVEIYDFDKGGYIPRGYADLFLQVVYPNKEIVIIKAMKGLPVPSIVTLSANDSNLKPINLKLVKNNARVEETTMQFGYQLGEKIYVSLPPLVIPANTAKPILHVAPDFYTFIHQGSLDFQTGFQFWETNYIGGTDDYTMNFNTLPYHLIEFTMKVGDKPSSTKYSHIRRNASNTHHSYARSVPGSFVRVTPQAYDIVTYTRLDKWDYTFNIGKVDASQVNGKTRVIIEGNLSMTSSIEKNATPQRGETLRISSKVQESHQYSLTRIRKREKDSGIGKRIQPIVIIKNNQGDPITMEVQYSVSQDTLQHTLSIPKDIALGKYTVQVSWDTGEYQGVVTGNSLTFEVVK